MKKDKNGNILKIGDKLKNTKGEVARIENICGVTRLVSRKNGRVVQTMRLNDVNLEMMEKVVC